MMFAISALMSGPDAPCSVIDLTGIFCMRRKIANGRSFKQSWPTSAHLRIRPMSLSYGLDEDSSECAFGSIPA